MIKTMKYMLTGLYLAIKDRRPSGTPYFNMRLFVTLCLELNLLVILLLLEKVNVFIIPEDKISFVSSVVILTIIIMFILSKIIPEAELINYHIEKRKYKRINLIFFMYFL